MAELLLVPEVAAGANEVVISEWLVQPGQSYQTGDALVVIETDKAIVEFEAESPGTLLKPLVPNGAHVEVGSPMALVGSSEEAGSDIDAMISELRAGAETAEPSSEDVAASTTQTTQTSDTRQVATSDGGVGETGSRIFISPIARKLLREADVDPSEVKGSGPHARIVRRDVEAVLAGRPAARASAPGRMSAEPTPDREPVPWSDVPNSRLRTAIAMRLTQSKQEVPHFYVKRTAVIDRLLSLRAEINEHSPVKVSVNDLVIRAVAVAHQEVPDANVIWMDTVLRKFDSVDVSVAVASDRGLVTPVLRGVEQRSVTAISRAVRSFVDQANGGRLQQKDLEGGSITVTNLGMYGVEEFAAIINPPQSSILAVGAGVPAARVADGVVTAVTTMSLVLSVDHRAIDGALAARWIAALVAALENPIRLLV